ncbi:actinia tenebrosa protease inhibitors-like isoform X2 [Dermacentor variabilis]|uniref:actinia tenebrosa protease inhibitors-like isoform X2 n=1 Tax=Dermacentor variabilis TaxID=34621 RepID=UPI003F5B63AB
MKLPVLIHLIGLSCLFYGEGKQESEPAGNNETWMPSKCNLPPEVGPCKAAIPRYYYNASAKNCLQFKYGGCGGNSNNFDSVKACKQECGRKQGSKPAGNKETLVPSECNLPPEVGPCKAGIPRYYYNASTHECLEFKYGGCKGNSNNFDSQQACEQRCARKQGSKPPGNNETWMPSECKLPPEVGPCKAGLPRYYYNASAHECLEFKYGGCKGNSNNFYSLQACEQGCARKQGSKPAGNNETWLPSECHLPPEVGPCKAAIPKYYYNVSEHACLEFIYGGCGGNSNKFDSKQECEQGCARKTSKPPANGESWKPVACSMPPETGVCKASIQRYYHNETMKRCLGFIYGGCGGNGNNFYTNRECERQCGSKYKKVKDPCLAPLQIGQPCGKYAATRMWYFDASAQKCKKPKFGYCGASPNRFSSCSQCAKTCSAHMKILQECETEKLPK